MRRRFPLWLYMLPCLCLGLPWLTACHGVEQRGTDTAESAPEGAPMSAVDALADNATEGYALALEPRAFRFPEDHGPHPEFKTEWWYFTGHLADDEGHRFGYQLTFFRQALQPGLPERSSQWATHQLYLAHFALSDIDGGAFHAFERWSRGAAG
ncbi:MAG: carotenoid 1,2-hydratase, partial [Acidobacteriota bacterium]